MADVSCEFRENILKIGVTKNDVTRNFKTGMTVGKIMKLPI